MSDGEASCQLQLGAQLAPRRPPLATPPPGGSGSRVPQWLASKVHRVDDSTFVVERSAVAELARNAGTLFRGTRLDPRPGTGLRLARVPRSSPLGMLGLRRGDVLHSVNDFDLSDPDTLVRAYGVLSQADSLTLRYSRLGKPLALQVDVR